jgi:hypothetical protein
MAEMARTTDSSRPLAKVSDSMSVVKPAVYGLWGRRRGDGG